MAQNRAVLNIVMYDGVTAYILWLVQNWAMYVNVQNHTTQNQLKYIQNHNDIKNTKHLAIAEYNKLPLI